MEKEEQDDITENDDEEEEKDEESKGDMHMKLRVAYGGKQARSFFPVVNSI